MQLLHTINPKPKPDNCIVSTSFRRDKKNKEGYECAKNSLGGITTCRGESEHKGTKTGEKEANHLSTGACTHIKRGPKKLLRFKDCHTSMILEQLDSDRGGK